jgi:hypothetical protein
MFIDDTTDFSTITVNDGVICDLDSFYNVSNWCKLVKQQLNRNFDMKGRTLDSNCNLSFNDGSTLVLRNAVFNGFSFGNMDVNLYSCSGSISFNYPKTLRLFDCSGGIVLSGISQNATIWSRYSQIALSGNIIIDRVNMLGGILSYQGDTPFTLSTKSSFEALGARIYCYVDGAYDDGRLSLTDCVVTRDVGGKLVFLRGCTVNDANVDAYSPYNGSDRNLITVDATGNKFLGSSKLRLRTTYSTASNTVYDLSFNVCGNFSDHDFVDDSAFNGVTHNVNISNCVYKGNYGGCPVESSSSSESISYSHSELSSGGNNGEIPSGQGNNTLRLYSDSRAGSVSNWDQSTTWWCLKVNKTLTLDSFNLFRFKYLHVGNSVHVTPKCICCSTGSEGVLGRCSNEISMLPFTVNFVESYQYSAVYTADYGLIGSAASLDNDGQNQNWYSVKIGQRFRYILLERYPLNWDGSCKLMWDVSETGFYGY